MWLQAFIAEGPTNREQPYDLPGEDGGLLDAETAEIHFIFRDHPLVFGEEYEETNMFNGSCPDGVGCANIASAIHLPPDAGNGGDDEDGGDAGGGGGIAGETLSYRWIFPEMMGGTTLEGPNLFVVGPGVELQGVTIGSANVDVAANHLEIGFKQALVFTGSNFNGHAYRDVNDAFAAFSAASVNGATTVPGFDASRLAFDAETLYIDLAGLSVGAGQVISIDFEVGGP